MGMRCSPIMLCLLICIFVQPMHRYICLFTRSFAAVSVCRLGSLSICFSLWGNRGVHKVMQHLLNLLLDFYQQFSSDTVCLWPNICFGRHNLISFYGQPLSVSYIYIYIYKYLWAVVPLSGICMCVANKIFSTINICPFISWFCSLIAFFKSFLHTFPRWARGNAGVLEIFP